MDKQRDYRSVIHSLWIGDFEWKKDHAKGFGIMAQQAYQYFPEAVTRPQKAGEFWQADYSKLSPLALWGVKDLYQLDQEKSQRIAELERQLKTLSKDIAHLRSAQASTFRTKLSMLDSRTAQ